MFLFLPDQFPDPAKVLHFPNEGNGKKNAGGDAWSLLHICLVTGGTLKCNFISKRHHWAHKQVVLVPTPLLSLSKHPHVGSLVSNVRPFFRASPSSGSAESFCWGSWTFLLSGGVHSRAPLHLEIQKEKQGHVLKMNRNCNIRMR